MTGSGEGWEDTRLVTPDQVEDLVVATLRGRHKEHLAALERRRGRVPRNIEAFKTIGYLADDEVRSSKDRWPAALVGCFALAGSPQRNENDAYDVPLQLAIEVIVLGNARRDTMRRRDWMVWSLIECVLQRTPRGDLINALRFTDTESIDSRRADEVLASERILFEVTVASMVSISGLPATDSGWTPGGPGGPPPDDEPYEPPVPLPPATEFEGEIVRESVSDT